MLIVVKVILLNTYGGGGTEGTAGMETFCVFCFNSGCSLTFDVFFNVFLSVSSIFFAFSAETSINR